MDDKRNPDDTARVTQPDVSETSEGHVADQQITDPEKATESGPHGHVPNEDEERFDAG